MDPSGSPFAHKSHFEILCFQVARALAIIKWLVLSVHMSRLQGILSLGLIMLLGGAVALNLHANSKTPQPRFHGELKQIIPHASPGWTLRLMPVAETEEMKKAVNELLNYDDGIYAEYRSGDTHLLVYLAYWKPNKMSYRLVAAHTPDVCWPANGWNKVDSRQVVGYRLKDGLALPPIETRVFRGQSDRNEYVWFWHIAGQKVISYGTGAEAPWYALFTDLLRNRLSLRDEQFFVRLSSNLPMESQLLESLLQELTIEIFQAIEPKSTR